MGKEINNDNRNFIDFLYNTLNHFSNWRIKQPFYRTFILTWVLVNWKMIYFILFVDEKTIIEKYNILKFEYLLQNYSFLIWNCWNDILLLFKFFIIPWFLTWLFIWIFPKYITWPALSKYSETQSNENITKKKFEIEQKREENKLYIVEKEKELKEKKFNIDEENLENKQIADNKDLWDTEYNKFKNLENYFKDFSDVINRINFHKWNMNFVFQWNQKIDDSLDTNTLSYLLSKDILKQSEKYESLYLFTTKWNYFKDKYIDEWNLREFKIKDPNHISVEDIPF
jgi:hypothetical protein